MKNLYLLAFILPLVFVGCSTADTLARRPLYSITETEGETIDGHFTAEDLSIHKEIAPGTITVISIKKIIMSDFVFFTLDLHFIGPDWKFYNSFTLKVDDVKYEPVVDDNPYRDAEAWGTNISMTEIVSATIPDDILSSLRSCESLVIQANGQNNITLVKIQPEGIIAIRDFIR